MGKLLMKLKQLRCGLIGHDDYVVFGRGQMFLKCVSCGRESSGWNTNPEGVKSDGR